MILPFMLGPRLRHSQGGWDPLERTVSGGAAGVLAVAAVRDVADVLRRCYRLARGMVPLPWAIRFTLESGAPRTQMTLN